MTITILDKWRFDASLSNQCISDENVEERINTFFISINDSFGTPEKPHFKENHSNVLNLFFDDIETDLLLKDFDTKEDIFVKCFTDEQAKEVIKFVDLNKDKSQCIIHCTAGVSRSGAIGKFISEYIPNSILDAHNRISPNPIVYEKLKLFGR